VDSQDSLDHRCEGGGLGRSVGTPAAPILASGALADETAPPPLVASSSHRDGTTGHPMGRIRPFPLAAATRLETLLLGLLLLSLLFMSVHWRQKTVIVVPMSDNPHTVIT